MLFEELSWRGFVNQVTHEELGGLLDKGSWTFYCGFDPTADSLHVGSLLPIFGLMHLQRAGHKPIVLVGGGTGLIGDPSGKSEERTLQTKGQVERNIQGIRAQLEHFLDFDGPNAAIMVNNADWLCGLPLIDFLRDIGKYFSVNVMLNKESVRQRVQDREHGMSFTEFSYSLLQAYDFLHLFDTYNCRLQVGGSDQWGNIVAGMDLTRRLRDAETFGLTFPLVTKADGTKFGKSEAGNVWLDSARTSPYKFYQFWINASDADTPRFLRFFTFLNRDEIARLEHAIQDAPEKRLAQRRLAEEVTRIAHGEEALANAVRASEAMFGGDLAGLDDATLEDAFSEVPSSERPRAELCAGRLLVDVLVESGVFASKGEGRRLIQSGGLYLNNARIDSAETQMSESSLCSEHIAVVRKGKKNYHLLRFV
ncbi:MAG TPA: tyrosine--tRNA ligase [Candidatus Hydrogenedentes bacterium]|nr:tyrosine--tRNA ligase [Candidatus Hydrogenedentota bacterium]HPG70137.1 tyrosine--tRNA ligase [Candidatus Hydrogenedentota bacterium]